MTEDKLHIDVLLVVPLAEELECIYDVFEYEADLSEGTFQFTKISSPTPELSVYLIKLKEMGNAAARDACNFVLGRYTVGLVVCYGIAGALKKDLKLGDVCVSHRILDLSDQFKVEDEREAISISPSPKHMEVDINLCSRLAFLCEHPMYRCLKNTWKDECLEFLLTVETNHPVTFAGFKSQTREDVRVFFGPIASYAVIASDGFVNTLKAIDRNILAIETESAGVFEVARNFDTPIITIRGISDFADSEKTALEVRSQELIRTIGSMNAAYYIKHQLKCDTIVDFLKDRRTAVAYGQREDLFQSERVDPLDGLLREIEEEIDAQLKEKCPAYRHKPKRSLLPSPRVVRVDGPSDPDKFQDWSVPTEIDDIVEQFERVMISLEPTYPDRALPWVIADSILRTNGTRIFVPIVVAGEQVSPNRFRLSKMDRVRRIASADADCATPVIILDDPNLQSNTRTRALIEEANNYPSARFVIVAKSYNAPATALSFSESFNCERFSVANVSLGALSDFVSSNFGYDVTQAAILATKLNDTFEQFQMHAHPSYFAGISPESLGALMAANRRGELIQLAVDAALMIMVVEDKGDVQVSKRWRREFLKDIVVKQFVHGDDVDEEKAVQLARGMAEKRDIDIKALEFVQSFVRAGLFDFTDRSIEFILVYVRDYLIAEYLHENPSTASSYFTFDEIDEDYNVLDIYSELGPSDRVIESVAQLIEADAVHLDEQRPETVDNLIKNRIELSEASKFERFVGRKQRLLKAIEYVGENPADLKRKQDLVDLKRSVSQRLGRRVSQVANVSDGNDEIQKVDNDDVSRTDDVNNSEQNEAGDGIPRRQISAHWTAACVMLGAGAEQIEAQPKRKLAKALIALGCRVAEQWTAEAASVDYKELREEILKEAEFRKRQRNMDEEEWKTLLADLDQLLLQLEFDFISLPYRTLLAGLCGQASGNILRKSVKEAKLDRDFQELTRAVWACDLEAENADKIFGALTHLIGRSNILRFVLAEHFVSRVYWAKWRGVDRQAFLEVATKILQGLDAQLDKGKLSRMIAKSSRND